MDFYTVTVARLLIVQAVQNTPKMFVYKLNVISWIKKMPEQNLSFFPVQSCLG
jgi:hypothetical protein